MAHQDGSKAPSWWHTLPGVLTATAGVITAITGLVAILIQAGVFSIGKEAPSPTPKPTNPNADHVLLQRSQFQSPLAGGATLHFYDFDTAARLDARTGEADFTFKPLDASNLHTRVGVDPVNGAKYAPRSAGKLPWEVDAAEFTASGGVYSVAQGEDIPCYTNDGRPCTFRVRLETLAQITVSFAVYR